LGNRGRSRVISEQPFGCHAVAAHARREEAVDRGLDVGRAAANQLLGDLGPAAAQRQLVRRPAVRAARVRIGAVLEQQLRPARRGSGPRTAAHTAGTEMAAGGPLGEQVHRQPAIRVRSRGEKQPRPLDVADADRRRQRSALRHAGGAGQKQPQALVPVVERRQVDPCGRRGWRHVRADTGLQEVLHPVGQIPRARVDLRLSRGQLAKPCSRATTSCAADNVTTGWAASFGTWAATLANAVGSPARAASRSSLA
jgi:hypothetical protein